MNARRFTIIFIAAFLTAVALGSNAVAAHGPGEASRLSPVPVSGTFTDADGAGTFSGTLKIKRFAARDGALVALGTVSGTLMSATGATRTIEDQPVTLPVTNISVGGSAPSAAAGPITTQQAAQDCQILHLEFGGITLNVLGVEVMLSPIVLDISLGGLLGGILCGLLGALGGGAPAPAQASMLNNALGLNP